LTDTLVYYYGGFEIEKTIMIKELKIYYIFISIVLNFKENTIHAHGQSNCEIVTDELKFAYL
jgi:hypothetical protein